MADDDIKIVGDLIRFEGDDCARINPNIGATQRARFEEAVIDKHEGPDPKCITLHKEQSLKELKDRFDDNHEDNANLFTAEEVVDIIGEYFDEVQSKT